MAMAGPSPHVPPQPLVPHSIPPLSSSSLCPDLIPRSATPPSSSPLQTSDNPISEHLQPAAAGTSTSGSAPITPPSSTSGNLRSDNPRSEHLQSSLPHTSSDLSSPAAAGSSDGQFSSAHPSLSQFPRRSASTSGRLAAVSSSRLAAANPAAGSSAGLPPVQPLPDPFPPLSSATSSANPSPSSDPIPPPLSSEGFTCQPTPQTSPPLLPTPPFPSLASAASPSPPPQSAATPVLDAAQAPGHSQQRKSYAQVTSGPRGPGFVRTHAIEVEAFARIPRTGAHIVCGSREGIPSFSFVHSDLPKVEEIYANALVMRFLGGRPSLEASYKEICEWGIVHPFSIGPLSSRAFLLRFQNDSDLLKVLTRPSSLLISFPYKIYRWHNQCHMQADSYLAPIWISLPRLPLQCFIPEFLEAVANKIGKFLCFDKATTTLARPSAARICVEIDLRTPPPPYIWVGLFDGLQQPVIYEKLPRFCSDCHILGHLVADCPKGHRETHHSASTRPKSSLACTQPVRSNVTTHSSINLPPSQAVNSIPNQSQLPKDPIFSHSTRVVVESADYNAPPSTLIPPSSTTNLIPAPTYPPFTPNPPPPPSIQSSKSPLAADFGASPSHHQHLNLYANVEFWNAVHRQMAILDQARLKYSSEFVGSPQALQEKHFPSMNPEQSLATHPNVGLDTESPTVAAPTLSDVNQLFGSGEDVCRTDSLNQPPPHPLHSMPDSAITDGIPSVCHNAAKNNQSANNPHKASTLSSTVSPVLATYKQQSSSKKNQSSTKSNKIKPSDVCTTLSQQQSVALERLKNKVLEQSRTLGTHTSSSANPFEVLRDEHSDEDPYVASYYSDTDDECVEAIDMGYQSAHGRSLNKHKDMAPSGMKINKRHPNMPLHVRLRSRKSSNSSIPTTP